VLRNGAYEIVVLPMETYVARVLVGEALPESAPAALEALAVAIRTYTVVNLGRHGADGFDLCDQTHCQVLRTSTPNAERAATATAGRVLLYKGALANIYYSASCGGRTERPSNVWPGSEDPPYLPSRHDDGCRGRPGWSAELSRMDLQRAFAAAGFTGSLRTLQIASRNESGRVSRLLLEGLDPSEVSGQDLRVVVGRTLGWQRIQSASFDLRRVGDAFRFSGRGAGHGVGMCVIGSAKLAAAGVSAADILHQYFPGTVLGAAASRVSAVAAATAPSSAAVVPTPAAAVVPLPSAAVVPATTPAAPPPPAVAAVPTSPGAAARASAVPPQSAFTASAATAVTAPAVRTTSSNGIALSLTLDDEPERGAIEALVSRARSDLAAALGIATPGGVGVRFHETTAAYEHATGQPWFTLGATLGTELHLLPLGILRDRGVLERTLRHQLVRAMTERELTGRPAWVREGTAIHFSEASSAPSVKGPCPQEADLFLPVSIGALGDALARARACVERQLTSGRSWRDVR
jgi:stage II sporulation protein D